MNKNIRFLLLSLIILCGCDQSTSVKNNSPANDSIQKYLALAGNDTLPFDKRIKYNDKALSFLDLERNDSLTRESLNILIYNYLSTNDHKKFKKNITYYFDKINKADDTLGFARYYRYNAVYFSSLKVYDSSFYYFLKAEKLYKKIKNEDGIAFVNLNMSHVQFKLDDYLGSELRAHKSLRYYKKTNNYDKQFHLLVNIGNANHNLNHYKKAIENFKHALSIAKKLNLKKKKLSFIGTCLNNIGNTYRVQKRYNDAIYYLKLGLKEKNIIKKDPEIYAYLLNNLGYCYLKTNRYKELPQLFEQSKKIFDSLGIKNESAISDVYLSEYYIKKKDSVRGRIHSERAIKSAKEAEAPYYYLTALTHAGSINSKKASKYIKEYHRINDSMLFAERTARNQYYKIQLETEEITQQKNTALKQRSIVIIVALTLVLIIILIFIITRQRLKQKEFRLQQTQQKANEEIYQLMLTQKSKEEEARQIEKKRIGRELHDGVMNKLASTRLNLSLLSISRDDQTIENCLNHILDIQNIEKEIRNIAHDLSQDSLYDLNSFEPLLKNLLSNLNQTNITAFELEINPDFDWNKLSSNKRMNLLRIIQEAGNNIIKYAKAQKATITFLMDEKNACLLIVDNGIGFKKDVVQKGIGIKNMKLRVKMMKGKFKLTSQHNLGTKINISIPLDKE